MSRSAANCQGNVMECHIVWRGDWSPCIEVSFVPSLTVVVFAVIAASDFIGN